MSDPKRLMAADPLGGAHFAVAGQAASGAPGDVRMYQWDRDADTLSIVGLQSDVGGSIKALAWCPHPAQRRLLALGLGTGRTQLFTLPQSSLTLTPGAGAGAPAAVLPVKHSRAVTALAWARADPALLAVGYERHRSDHSLLVWDAAEAIAALPPDPLGDSAYRRPGLDSAPQGSGLGGLAGGGSGLAGLAGLAPLARADRCRLVAQYCPSEAVQSAAWAGAQLLASANGKAVRTYDLRARDGGAGGSGAVAQWATKAVHHLTPNPAHAHQVASVEQLASGGVVRLWDTRAPGAEVASVDVRDAGPVAGLQWLPGPTATLGVATRDGGIRLWDMVDVHVDGRETLQVGGMRVAARPKAPLQAAAFLATGARDVAFVVRDGTIGIGPVAAPTAVALSARSDLATCASALGILDPEGAPTPGASAPASPEGDARRNRFQLPPERVSAILSSQRARSGWSTPASLGRAAADDAAELDALAHSLAADFGDEAASPEGFARVLRHDAAFVMRARAGAGYGPDDAHLNAAVATRGPDADRLAGVWEFVDHFVRATAPSVSVKGAYDLTHQGLWAIWTGELGADAPDAPASAAAWGSLSLRQDKSGASTPRHADGCDAEYTAAVAGINALRAAADGAGAPGSHRLPHTARGPQRRMLLALCGENAGFDALAEADRLVAEAQRTKAACWAFFAGEEEPAITILMRSPDDRHRLMAATIAGFMTQAAAERGSLFWQEHWRGLVDRVDDPYIRAVLSKIAGENWDNILYDESLPLLDRCAIAVCNLSDRELTAFLKNRLHRCIQMGALAGLALTGFAGAGVALLQRFADRTSDVQTVALLSVYFNRSRLSRSDANRLVRWQDAYRALLDSWLAWVPRCAFDVALADARRARGEAEPAADAQTIVTCPVCHGQLTREFNDLLGVKKTHLLRGGIRPPSVRTTQCLYCQNALPRCCICLLHVDPDQDDSKGDGLENAYVTCQSCRHGGHASHILAWFEGGLDGEPEHDACPVSGCECRCASW